MKIINVVNDIMQFNVSENIFLDLKGSINFDTPYSNIREFVSFKNSVLLIGKEQKIINNIDFPNIPENFTYKHRSATKNYFILVDSDSLDFETFICTKEAFYCIKEKKIISINDLAGNCIFYDYSVGQIGRIDYLFVIHIPSKTKITNFPLTNLGTWLDGAAEKPYQVAEFSGLYENTLVCTLTSGAILLLDIEKGEVKAFFEDAFVKRNLQPKEEGSAIYCGLSFVTYIEIDVSTAVILKHVNLESYLRDFYINPSLVAFNTTLYQNGLIYFQSSYNIVGIFNPTTYKIIDFHEFDFDRNQGQQLKGGKENLQVKDGKIYCLDTLGNLYELER